MKVIISFIRDTLTGGILFLLPVVLIIMLLVKAHEVVKRLVAPLSDLLPSEFLGFNGAGFLALIMLVVICFLGGLLFQSTRVKEAVGKLEDNFLSLLPGYTLIKTVTADAIGKADVNNLMPVKIQDGDSWRIGFLAERDDKNSVVFFPEPTNSESGEVKIIPNELVQEMKIPTQKVVRSMKSFGKGLLQYMDQ